MKPMKQLLIFLILPLFLISFILTSCLQFEMTEEEASYESVVFIGVDGAGRWLGEEEDFINIFSTNSAWTTTATCEMPSATAQNWGSFLHGVSPDVHKCVNASIACERFPYLQYPSVFKIIHEVYPNAKLASFCESNAINYGLVEASAGVYKSSDKRFCSTVHSTAQIEQMAIEYLSENSPTFFFIHIEDADDAGHSKGYGTSEHLAAVKNDVAFIKKINSLLDYNKTLLIVATDHGGIEKDHGGDTVDERQITIAIKGHTVTESTLSSSVMPKDITPVILKALGIKKPSFMEGDIPENLTI